MQMMWSNTRYDYDGYKLESRRWFLHFENTKITVAESDEEMLQFIENTKDNFKEIEEELC